jgi:hypothetical protein
MTTTQYRRPRRELEALQRFAQALATRHRWVITRSRARLLQASAQASAAEDPPQPAAPTPLRP